MFVKEIWVSTGLTLNLGNYESARMDAGVKVTVEEGKDPQEAYKLGWNMVEAEISKQATDIKSEMAKRYKNKG